MYTNISKGSGSYRMCMVTFVHIVSIVSEYMAFGATFKIHKKSNFDQNQLKLSTQHKYMYMYQDNSLLFIFGKICPKLGLKSWT